ncbi:MAG: hypothetical protein DRJ32_03280 [Thermoprotei archaeon]|nr:MAG: hypothetical protein DRJ32_03280 [Thermoprotei archaeon]
MRGQKLGYLIFLASVAIGIFYFASLLLLLVYEIIPRGSMLWWTWWTLIVPVAIIVFLVLFFTTWVGWIMIKSSPKTIKQLMEDEIKDVNRKTLGRSETLKFYLHHGHKYYRTFFHI